MTTMFISTQSFKSLSPSTVKGFDVDGIVDNKPVRVRYNKHGGLIPSVGSTLLTTYGVGVVKGYDEGALRVAITRFNEDYVFETADGLDIRDAEECVARLAMVRNSAIDSHIRTITRLYASEITGKLPKTKQEYVDSIERFEPNEFVMSLSAQSKIHQIKDGAVLVDVIATARETAKERKARKALEIADAKRLRKTLLEKYDDEFADDVAPDDIQDELNEEFGEDGEF